MDAFGEKPLAFEHQGDQFKTVQLLPAILRMIFLANFLVFANHF
jgi:hypothetical protein